MFTFLYEKNTPLGSQQTSFLNDYEATREARMLQAPIKGRKLARNWRTAVEGRVAILLGMLHAKETWISSGRLDLWLVCAFTFLPFFNASVRISSEKVIFHYVSACKRQILILS